MMPGFFSLEGSAFHVFASAGPCLLVVSLSPGELTEGNLNRGTSVEYICIFTGSLGATKEHLGS